MTSATGFVSGSAVLQSNYTLTMSKIARVLNQYGKTTVSVIGHTDSVGSHKSNQTLSKTRA